MRQVLAKEGPGECQHTHLPPDLVRVLGFHFHPLCVKARKQQQQQQQQQQAAASLPRFYLPSPCLLLVSCRVQTHALSSGCVQNI